MVGRHGFPDGSGEAQWSAAPEKFRRMPFQCLPRGQIARHFARWIGAGACGSNSLGAIVACHNPVVWSPDADAIPVLAGIRRHAKRSFMIAFPGVWKPTSRITCQSTG